MAGTFVFYDIVARDNASKTMGRVSRSTSKTGAAFAAMGKKVAVAGAAVAAAATAVGVEAVKMSTHFQDSMTRVRTQAGGSAKDVRVLSNAVLNLGKYAQQSPQELADSLYHLKSVGMDNVNAMHALKTAADLAAVGGADLESTTNALAGAWRTGIKGARNFGQAAATINAIIGAGNMRMEDFVAAIGTGILPVAKTFGLSLKQVGAALALFTDEGVPATDAATRLRMSMSLLGAPSQQADKVLHTIGLSGLKLAQAMRSKGGLIAAIQLLKDHLEGSGLSAAKQSQILSRAFGGGRSSAAIMSMVNNLDVLKQKQDQVNKGTSRYADAVKAQRKTAQAQFALLKSSAEVTMIRIGNVLLPPVVKFVQFLNGPFTTGIGKATAFAKSHFGGAFGGLYGTVKRDVTKVSTFISDFARGFTTTWKRVGQETGRTQLVPFVPHTAGEKAGASLKDALSKGTLGKTLGDALSNAFDSIDWNKLGGKLGDLMGTVLGGLTKYAGKFGNFIADALGSIDWATVGGKVGGGAIGFALGFIAHLGDDLFTVSFWKKHWLDVIIAVISLVPFGKLLGVVGKLLSKVPWGKVFDIASKVPWGKVFGAIGRFFERAPVFRWVTGLAKRFGGAVAGAFRGIGKLFDFAKPIGGAIKSAVGAVGRFFGRIGGAIGEGARDAVVSLGQFFGAIGRSFVNWVIRRAPVLATRFEHFFAELPGRLTTLVKGFPAVARKWMRDLWGGFVKHFPGGKQINALLHSRIVKWFTRFTLWNAGINLITGLLNGIWQKMKGIGTWLKKHVVDPVVNWVKSLFGIHSPSTVFVSIGHSLINGLLNGIKSFLSHPLKTLRNLAARVTGVFAKAGNWLIGKGRQIVSGLAHGITQFVKHPVTSLTRVKNRAVGVYNKAGNWLVARGRQLVSGLVGGITQFAKHPMQSLTRVKNLGLRVYNKALSWLPPRGRQIVTGLNKGIVQFWKHPVQALTRIKNQSVGVYRKAGSWLVARGRQLVTGLNNGIVAFWKHPVNALIRIKNHSLAVYNKAGNWLVPRGRQLVNGLTNGINSRRKSLFGAINSMVGGVVNRWGRLKGGTRSASVYVVNSVLRRLVAEFNQVSKSFGGKAVKLPKFRKGGPVRKFGGAGGGGGFVGAGHGVVGGKPSQLATGGPVRGPGGPTSDVIPALLSNGEHVLTAKEVAGLGGHAAVMAVRQMGRKGERVPGFAQGGPVQRFANGGAVLADPVSWIKKQNNRVVDMVDNFKGTQFLNMLHAMPPRIAALTLKKVKDTFALGSGPFIQILKSALGRPYVWGATGPNAFDCSGLIYWALAKLGIHAPRTSQQQYAWTKHIGQGAAVPGDLAFWDPGHIHHVGAYLGGNKVLNAPHTGAKVRIQSLWGHPLFGRIPGLAQAGGMGSAVGGGGPVASIVKRTAAQFGWGGGSEWSALSWLISHESGWRPTAKNPSSSAYGLFQFLNGTWGSVGGHKTSNPALQALYGMRYIRQKYHDPLGAKRFWQRHHWYDSGGWLYGDDIPHSKRSKPEAVLTPEESRAYVDMAKAAASGGGGTQTVVLELHSGGTRLDDALVEILRKAIRVKGGDVQVVLGNGKKR